jgi:hypothetical protein
MVEKALVGHGADFFNDVRIFFEFFMGLPSA